MALINFQNTLHYATAGSLDQCPQEGIPEVVLAGRSNVGKSSLINALANKRNLARVSQTPGKTRLVLYFLVDQQFFLTDLPGYGYAKASKEKITEFSRLADDYLTSDRPIALVLVLLDIRHDPTEEDQMIIDYLEHHEIPYVLVLNKADKFSKAQADRQVASFRAKGLLPENKPYFVVSASGKQGLAALQQEITRYI